MIAIPAVLAGCGVRPDTIRETSTPSEATVLASTQRCSPASTQIRVGGAGGSALLGLSDPELDRELGAASAAGMFSVRVDIDWSAIEPVPGGPDWANTDRVINAVIAHGMCPLGLLGSTPAWARDPSVGLENAHGRPAVPQVFAQFAAAAAQRYHDRIPIWEVWNEPNSVNFFAPAPNVDQYAQLLAAGYGSIKGVDPGAFVLSGGLAPAVDDGTDIAPVTFIRRMYELGANKYFDAFAMHPYTHPALPDDPATAEWSSAQRMQQMRDVMVAGGDESKQIWATEFGAPTGTGPGSVSDAVQAESIGTFLATAADTSWIGPVYIFNIRDSGTDLADPEQNFGLLRYDFTPKPAYTVVTDFTRRTVN